MVEIHEILEQIDSRLSKIERKIDKNTNLLTKIAKVLHLVPVTEKEEREFQITQRTNLQQAAKVNDELDQMSNANISQEVSGMLKQFPQYELSVQDIFGDVLADDYLGGSLQ